MVEQLFEKIDALVAEMKQLLEYPEAQKAYQQILKNQELLTKIAKFQMLQESYIKKGQRGMDIQTELKYLQQDLFSYPEYVNYLNLKKQITYYFEDINYQINQQLIKKQKACQKKKRG